MGWIRTACGRRKGGSSRRNFYAEGDKLIPIHESSPGNFARKFSMPIPRLAFPNPARVSPNHSLSGQIFAQFTRYPQRTNSSSTEFFLEKISSRHPRKSLMRGDEVMNRIGMIPM
jgi:hypothetical protein